jgi:hypothetical protein
MALPFLGTLGTVLNTAGQVAGPIGTILSAFGIGKSKQKQAPMSEAERYALSMLQAIGQPNNSLVKQLSDEEFANMHSGVLSDINEKVLADRRERSMGRAPVFFDPERRDENIASQISRGTPMLRQQAQQNAIQRILQAVGVGQFAPAQQNRINAGIKAQAADKETLLAQGGFGGIAKNISTGLQDILRAINGDKTPIGNSNTITWDPLKQTPPIVPQYPNKPSIQWYPNG